jgi:ribose transport system substrate-binding protein
MVHEERLGPTSVFLFVHDPNNIQSSQHWHGTDVPVYKFLGKSALKTTVARKLAPSIGRGLRAIVLILAAAVLAFSAGCRRESTAITLIPRSTGTLLGVTLRKGAEDGLQRTKLHIQWDVPPDDGGVDSQLNLVEAATVRRDRGIIFAPDETLASRSIVLEAVQQRIPVVIVDDELGPPPGPFLSYVSSDEAAAVQLAVQRLAQQLHGQGSVAVIGINAMQEGSVSREVLFERSLTQNAPRIRIVLRQWGDGVITHQQQICQELLRGPSPPDAIVALSSTATRGAYYAKIANSDPLKTVIIGFDQDDRDMVFPIRTGDVDAVVMQNTRAIGERAARNILAQLNGQSFPSQTFVAPLLVTREL